MGMALNFYAGILCLWGDISMGFSAGVRIYGFSKLCDECMGNFEIFN